MSRKKIRISSPDEINKHLQSTSPFTWIILIAVIALLIAFFTWSFVYKLTVKITGKADISSGAVTLHLSNADLNRLQVGQKVYIEDKEGEILSFNDKTPTVSTFDLSDGEYTYTLIVGQMRPIDFLLGK